MAMTLTWAKEREREKGRIERMIDSSDTRVQKVEKCRWGPGLEISL